ncbi:MAG: prepilin peptidase [Planctomycetia bacterium]
MVRFLRASGVTVLLVLAAGATFADPPESPPPIDPPPSSVATAPAEDTDAEQRRATNKPPPRRAAQSFDDKPLGLVAAEWVTAAYFGVFGAVVGSFLNVVVYRLPHGMSVVHPPSHCPGCETPIRLVDNIPVFGWLKLRGRCRACGIAISARYPIVEFAVAVLFQLLAAVETLRGGANLPGYDAHLYTGVVWIVWHTKYDMMAFFVYHAVFVSYLTAMVLIQYDRNPLPVRLAGWGMGLGFVGATAFGFLLPVPPWPGFPDWPVVYGATTSLMGGMVGWAVGVTVTPVQPRGRKQSRVVEIEYAHRMLLVLVGVYMGWQAAVVVALGAALVELTTAVFRWKTGRSFGWLPPTAAPAVLAYLLLLTWRPTLELLPFLPGPTSIAAFGLAAMAAGGFAAWLAQLVSDRAGVVESPTGPAFVDEEPLPPEPPPLQRV